MCIDKQYLHRLIFYLMVLPVLAAGLLFSSLSFASPSAQPAKNAYDWIWWEPVGSATLTWGFWKIYDSELRTPTGSYQSDDIPVALVITYSRNIESADLLEATVEQWEHLGISNTDIASWVPEMDGKWSDVNKGDRLIYVFNGEQGTFYYQPKNGDVSLSGHLNDSALAKAFSDIWLSPNTSYPSVRLALIGSKPQ